MSCGLSLHDLTRVRRSGHLFPNIHTMKKLLLALLFLPAVALGQAPKAFNYQSVVRDALGEPLAGQNVSFRMSIRQGVPPGTVVYQETHNTTTNAHGLANLQVGLGNILVGAFGLIDWSLGSYYLQSELDVNGGSAYVDMGSMQLLSVPYALFAGSSTGGGNTLDGAYDQGGLGAGRAITVDAGEVDLSTATPNGIALRTTHNASGVAILANSLDPNNTFSTVQSATNSTSNIASAVIGSTTGAAWGVSGQVDAAATAESAVYGSNLRTNGGHGVLGIGFNGVVGQTDQSTGNAMYAENFDAIAPLGNGIAVAGSGYWGVVGQDRYLGSEAGAYGVLANGELGATGLKSFIIDHPLDPADRFLKHFSLESNEVLNVYRGNATFDGNGEAVVEMPDYYEHINTDPSYQLTPIGGWMQLYIKEELKDGRFTIAGGTPGGKASWTVHAQRNDPYLQQHPEKRAVEVPKRAGQQGRYFMPSLYGQGDDTRLITAPAGKVEQVPLGVK